VPANLGSGQRCLRVDADSGPKATVPAAGLIIRAQGDGVRASLRRYATASYPDSLGALPAGQAGLLRIPADRSAVPWTLQLTGHGTASVCPAEAPAP
jgi:hypothetical protein